MTALVVEPEWRASEETSPAAARVDAKSSAKPPRLKSLDAYRGFVMLLMASEGLGIAAVARALPDNKWWQAARYQVDHVAWRGCSLWDLIQPSFMFMVGVAMVWSLASRRAKGQSFGWMFAHACWRALLLCALGIFLRSTSSRQTYFTFEDVLTQIGLGYVFLFLLAWTKPRWQIVAAAAILFGYWLAFALYPTPAAGFDFKSVGVPASWEHLQGFAAHWDKNTNLAARADQWFLNLWPRAKPFVYNGGGYLTLNFVPSLATMIFGLLAGNLIKNGTRRITTPWQKVGTLVALGLAGLLVGWVLDVTGVCPSVKRIWTPSWAIFAGGWTCILLAGFYAVIDVIGFWRWSWFMIVVGMNSIAMYVMAHLWDGFIRSSFKIHLGQGVFTDHFGVYAPIAEGAAVLFVLWLICAWMWKRGIFLKI
jgi:predicted acyltransferase